MKAYIIKRDGEQIEEVDDNLHHDFAKLYKHLDCNMVQRVSFAWGEMWCDEEGLLKPNLKNPIASALRAEAWSGYSTVPPAPIVGHVLVRIKDGYDLIAEAPFIAKTK